MKLCQKCGTETIFNGSQEICPRCLTIYIHSDQEHKEKLRKSLKGKKRPPFSEEWKRKIGEGVKKYHEKIGGDANAEKRRMPKMSQRQEINSASLA